MIAGTVCVIAKSNGSMCFHQKEESQPITVQGTIVGASPIDCDTHCVFSFGSHVHRPCALMIQQMT